MSLRARYMIEYHAAILRRAGDGDADIMETLGVVDHYTALNTLSEGMQIESDIVPPSSVALSQGRYSLLIRGGQTKEE